MLAAPQVSFVTGSLTRAPLRGGEGRYQARRSTMRGAVMIALTSAPLPAGEVRRQELGA